MSDESACGSIIFVNRYFWPDRSATSQILSDVAFHLADSGHDVQIIASRLSYENDEGPYPVSETHHGVRIHRVATPAFGRGSIVGRIADYLGFYVTSFARTLSVAKAGDVVVAKTDPPVLSWPIGIAARLKGAKRANWLQDLYPEVAEAFGVVGQGSLLARIVRSLRDRSLRKADLNIAIGNRMAQLVRTRGVSDQRVAVIPNMTDDELVRPVAPDENRLRREWGIGATDMVIGYSGNLGRAHDIDTLLGAARILQGMGRADIRFLVIGGGYLRDQLEREIAGQGLRNFILKPYQPREQLHLSLTVPDVHWLSLRPALEGLIVPSKFYGAAASGRPVVFIGDPAGEIGPLLTQARCGAVIEEGASQAFADLLAAYADDPAERLSQGQRARDLITGSFSRSAVFAQWRQFAASVPQLAKRGN